MSKLDGKSDMLVLQADSLGLGSNCIGAYLREQSGRNGAGAFS